MKLKIIPALVVACLAVVPVFVNAKGCLKGAAVGGVGGHVVGHHGVLGAAAGCAVGRHNANKRDAKAAAEQQPTPTTPPVQPQNNPTPKP